MDRFFHVLHQSKLPVRFIDRTAVSHARAKLKPSAFIELSNLVLSKFRSRQWLRWDLRVVDASLLRLPDTPSLREAFGQSPFTKQDPGVTARASFISDPLNNLFHDAILAPVSVGERSLLLRQIPLLKKNSLLVADRGYAAFHLFALILERDADFCFRLPIGSWPCAKQFVQSGLQEEICTIEPSREALKNLKKHGIESSEITVRLVRIDLPNGQIEVLVTSILNPEHCSVQQLDELYQLRWGIEEQIKTQKAHIEIENFSGKTPLAIKQDFYARLFMANLSTFLAQPAQAQIESKYADRKHPYKINWTQVAAKLKMIGVGLFLNSNINQTLKVLHQHFLNNVSVVRKGRSAPRPSRRYCKLFAVSYKPIS